MLSPNHYNKAYCYSTGKKETDVTIEEIKASSLGIEGWSNVLCVAGSALLVYSCAAILAKS